MMKNNKGQAAMEFLMTYGWAMIAVLTAVGALAYFGVVDLSQFTPNICYTTATFECMDGSAALYGDHVEFLLRNNKNFDIVAMNVTLIADDGYCPELQAPGLTSEISSVPLEPGNFTPPNIDYSSGGMTFPCTATKDSFKGEFRIDYQLEGETNYHTAYGVIEGNRG